MDSTRTESVKFIELDRNKTIIHLTGGIRIAIGHTRLHLVYTHAPETAKALHVSVDLVNDTIEGVAIQQHFPDGRTMIGYHPSASILLSLLSHPNGWVEEIDSGEFFIKPSTFFSVNGRWLRDEQIFSSFGRHVDVWRSGEWYESHFGMVLIG